MDRMLHSLKLIETKQTPPQPPGEEEHQENPPATIPPAALTAKFNSMAEKITAPPCDIDLDRLDTLIQDELQDGQSFQETIENCASCAPISPAAEFDAPVVEEAPNQAESAQASALLPAEPDGYREMAQYIIARITPGRPAALMLTSAGDGEGKTAVLFSLAKTLVNHLRGDVCVVDANFQHPDFTRRWEETQSPGLTEVLSGSAAWKNAVCHTEFARLDVLPNQGRLPCKEKSFVAEEWGRLFQHLKTQYQLILVDAPSLAHEETAPLISQCDGVYLVIRLGFATPQLVRDAVNVIQQAGGLLLGSIAVD